MLYSSMVICIYISVSAMGNHCLFAWVCCVGTVTCLYLSNISVDSSAVAVHDDSSHRRDVVHDCVRSSVVYLCTSHSQLVECRAGRLTTAVDLPFSDGVSIKELELVTGSTVVIVQSSGNMVAVVDTSKYQVHPLLLLLPQASL